MTVAEVFEARKAELLDRIEQARVAVSALRAPSADVPQVVALHVALNACGWIEAPMRSLYEFTHYVEDLQSKMERTAGE